MNDIVEALSATDLSGRVDVKDILDAFHADPEPAPLSPYFDDIDDHFDHETIESVTVSLTSDASEWAQKQHTVLAGKSPTGLKLTFEQLQRGAAAASFKNNMEMEFRMVNHIMAGPDFHEGVRALLLDKDNPPKWCPVALEGVSDALISSHFESLGPLELFKK